MNYLTSNIKFLRSTQDKTQRYCADYVGTTPSNWNNYELGRNKPKFEILISISEMFSVSIDDLVKLDLRDVHLSEKVDSQCKTAKSTPKSAPISTPNYPKTQENNTTVHEDSAPYAANIWQARCQALEQVVSTQKLLISSLQAQIKLLERTQ